MIGSEKEVESRQQEDGAAREPRDTAASATELIHEVARLQKAYFDRCCEPLGVTRSQLSVMCGLVAKDGDAPSQTSIADQLGIGRSAAGESLARLERVGLIRREEDPNFRVAKRILIGRRGRIAVEKFQEIVRRERSAISRGVVDEDLLVAERVLSQIKDNLVALLQVDPGSESSVVGRLHPQRGERHGRHFDHSTMDDKSATAAVA